MFKKKSYCGYYLQILKSHKLPKWWYVFDWYLNVLKNREIIYMKCESYRREIDEGTCILQRKCSYMRFL